MFMIHSLNESLSARQSQQKAMQDRLISHIWSNKASAQEKSVREQTIAASVKLQWKSRVCFWKRKYRVLSMFESLSYQSWCSEMIEQASSTTEDSKRIFSFKNVEDSCWKDDILVAEERISFFSEKIAKKALQEKQKYSLSSYTQLMQALCHKDDWFSKVSETQSEKESSSKMQLSHCEMFSDLWDCIRI